MAELVLTVEKIEDTMRYDMGTQLVEAYGSSHAAPHWPIPQGVRANNPPRPPFPLGNRSRWTAVVNPQLFQPDLPHKRQEDTGQK